MAKAMSILDTESLIEELRRNSLDSAYIKKIGTIEINNVDTQA